MIPQEKGVTIVELLVAMALLAILLVVTVTFYPPVIKTFNAGKDDFDLRSDLATAREVMSNYLTKASTFTMVNPGRMNFTANVDVTTPLSENCTFYLYNASDAGWPTTYPYVSYELRYTEVNVFGSGRTIAYNLNPPNLPTFPSTYFESRGNNNIAVNLNATKNTQNFELRFEIHPRNL
ncbi:MAG: prepilin-type N-terminal cleavage/methylation domain-containing protein [Elusimicrobia bacterium]|nr:prepilin-type N-terminal cleavage/methylation domain-containing protein [Elusimicrobiota bacterium]